MSNSVKLHRVGNTLIVNPTTPRVIELLRPVLSFEELVTYYGYEKIKRQRQGLKLREFVHHKLFDFDQKNRLFTLYGFWKLVRDTLRKHGYEVTYQDHNKNDIPAYKAWWSNLEDFQLRANQPEFLQTITKYKCGRFNCPPGFGKSFMIGMIALLYPKAKIDIVSRNVAVLRDTIYSDLKNLIGHDVGIVGGTLKKTGHRVMCYTVGSMHHSDYEADILIGDECHQLAADQSFSMLPRWSHSRNYGLSASHDKRMDNKDIRVHGIFGPIVFDISYQQAQLNKMVVPLVVSWREVTEGPSGNQFDDPVEKKRFCIWRNVARNKIIAEDARKYDENTQTLIIVDTIDHAMHLKRELPEFTLVYMEKGIDDKRMQEYAKLGCCTEDEPKMDFDRRKKLTSDFEKGILKKVIATGVWNVGVSFNSLAVLIRADAGGSEINDIQIPGRVSRIAEGKEYGIIHDYLDNFCYSFKRRSSKRSKSYENNQWKQVYPA